MTRTTYETKAKDLHKEVYRLYKAGYNKREIADSTGYSESYVDVLIRKMKPRTERKLVGEADKARIIKLRKEGLTIQKIADEIGFSAAAVQRCLKIQKEAEKAKEETKHLLSADMTPVSIPSGTVIYETVREDGTVRKIKWTFVKQYPYHALFISQYGKRRCFPNAELMNKGIYK